MTWKDYALIASLLAILLLANNLIWFVVIDARYPSMARQVNQVAARVGDAIARDLQTRGVSLPEKEKAK